MEGDNRPAWLGKEKSTRQKSDKQENRLAKTFSGKKTANSGARFGENDVTTPEFEIEAKTTEKKQYILKLEDWQKMQKKARVDKKALYIVEFAGNGEEIVMLNLTDFLDLLKLKQL